MSATTAVPSLTDEYLDLSTAFSMRYAMVYVSITRMGCSDPIASASPCNRPALLAGLFQQLGAHANPLFSRAVLMQESRHCHLISVALPDRDLKVTHTWMTQETDRPDVATPTMNVRFAYCGYRYGFSRESLSAVQEMLPLPVGDPSAVHYAEPWTFPTLFMDESLVGH